MRRTAPARALGLVLLALAVIASLGAPSLAPYPSRARFPGLLNAPPTRVQIIDADGQWHAPFIHPWRLVNQLEQQYELDRDTIVPLVWFQSGRIVLSGDESKSPLLLLGTDSYGRDQFSRLLYGARLSLALAVTAALGAMLLGALVGGIAGYTGGTTDTVMTSAADFVLVLPAMYVALVLRAVLPLVLTPGEVFALLAAIFAIIGAPFVARSVRGVVRTERTRDYAVAARSIGASPLRVLVRHLLPAARGVLAVQATLLVPGFIVSEATLSYVGLGFADPIASWGTLLNEAANLRAFVDFPWRLSPALAMFTVVLALNLVAEPSHPESRIGG